VALGVACANAILGKDDEVRSSLKRAQKGKSLAWEPMLKDTECFKRLADDPDYRAVVRHFDDLRAMLRERLPETLARYGVSL
jgi:hypothetical protein